MIIRSRKNKHSLEYLVSRIPRDVKLVRDNARVVFELTPNGIEEHWGSDDPHINAIAVVGPAEAFERKFDEALLLEVGISRTHPYRMINLQKRRRGFPTPYLPRRRPVGTMRHEIYTELSPRIFSVLQKLTDKQVRGWKSGPFFNVASRRWFLAKKGGRRKCSRGRFVERKIYEQCIRGAKFSVAKRDTLLLADLYWAQLHNRRLCEFLTKYTRHLAVILAEPGSKRGRLENTEEVKLELTSKLSSQCLSGLDHPGSLTPYILMELPRYVPQRFPRDKTIRELLREIVIGITGRTDGVSPEKELAERVVPHPEERLCGVELRDISGARPSDTNKDYVVVELFPTLEHQEEIPF